ncbi:MAG: hypothetical protein Q9184_007521, partial [Pyrenodesmia sp. 2 TL-2023]
MNRLSCERRNTNYFSFSCEEPQLLLLNTTLSTPPNPSLIRLLSHTLTLKHHTYDHSPPAKPPSSHSPPMLPPIHLILDWDSTLTITSTLPLIALIGYTLNPSPPIPPWDTISEAYMSDYRAHVSAYSPPATDRKTVKQELEWLESLRDVERQSMERAEAAGLFKGVGREEVWRAAEGAVRERNVVLRKGWS